MVKVLVILLLVIACIMLALMGNIMSQVEQPKYKVLSSHNNIEMREYAPMIIAETEVSGNRREAIEEGFKIIADYIFGNNTSRKKMEMKRAEIQQSNEKIAMTAPVMQEKSENTWKVRFVMPSEYTLETLPKPNSSRVSLISIPAKFYYVIQFSGLAGNESIQRYTKELEDYMASKKIRSIGTPVLAFYNPPWTLPFLRRNEIMIETAAS